MQNGPAVRKGDNHQGKDLAAILLSIIPEEKESNKPLAVAKVVDVALLLVIIGAAIYVVGNRSALRKQCDA